MMKKGSDKAKVNAEEIKKWAGDVVQAVSDFLTCHPFAASS